MTNESSGKRIIVRFAPERCIRSRACQLALPTVFSGDPPGLLIDPDAADPGDVASAVTQCPSGALVFERTDGGPQELAPTASSATIREDGPILVHAGVVERGAITPKRAAICRCGASRRMPECDGSHAIEGFRAKSTLSRARQSAEPTGGPVVIVHEDRGPLRVEGSIEVRSSEGVSVHCGPRTLLCRCGASAIMPFCDGSHLPHRKSG